MDIMQLLSMLGGLGGANQIPGATGFTPNTVGFKPPPGVIGINPAAPPPGQTGGMPEIQATAKRPFMDRLAMQLFQSQNQGQGSTPEQRRNAMLMLGLGMMSAGAQGKGLGEGLFGAYAGAQGNFQGAMDRAFLSSERKRLEEKEDKRRAEDLDWRKLQFTTEAADRQADRALRAKQIGANAGYDAARSEQARMELEQERLARELSKPIEDKLRRGERLTQEEKDLYQLLRTGRQPSFNPLSLLMMGGGLGMPPGMAPGGNPLLDDPRL